MNASPGIPITVFVVDDDDAVRDLLKLVLDAHGFDVEDFGSVSEFVRGYQKLPCACLILDHCMHPITGLDFLEWVKEEGSAFR